jgi:PKD repeat protein
MFASSLVRSLFRPAPRKPRPAGRYQPSVEALEKRELLTNGVTGPLHFDFGPATSPVASGYTGVSLVTYTAAQGYGWKSLDGLSALDQHTSNPLTTDFIRGTDATFKVDLANGTYEVTPTLGDNVFVRDDVALYAEGQQLASGLTTAAGQFITPTYAVQVTDGQLDLRIVDQGGATPQFAIEALDISTPPVANAGPSRTTSIGKTVTFAGSASGSSALTYSWNFGDGSTTSGTLTPTHVYAEHGTFTVTLTVTDALGISSQSTTTARVYNAPPTASIGGPSTAAVGESATFAANATDADPADVAAGFSYAWDFGDGATGQGASPSHAYLTPGTYTVAVTVTDSNHLKTTADTTFTVQPIYAASTGLYVTGNRNSYTAMSTLNNANIDGLVVRADWSFLESAEGKSNSADANYNWSYLDTEINAAVSAGKKVALSVTAGIRTPSWVYHDGAQAFHFTLNGTPEQIPVPWDPVFLTKWETFVTALGQRYDSNPAITRVDLTGINTNTTENFLPHTATDVTNWQAIGYTRTKLETAWESIADTWAHAFAGKQISLAIVPNGFPTIDGNGNVFHTTTGGDNQTVTDLINLGVNRYAGQFVVQNNGLSDTWSSATLVGLANEVSTGFQMLCQVTGDGSYRVNGGKAIKPVTALQNALDKGLAAHAHFLEIYQDDANNAAFQGVQGVLAEAQAALAQNTVPTATITGLPTGTLLEGTNTFTLGSAIADLGVNDPSGYTYSWSVTHNGQTVATGTAAGFSFTATGTGDYVVSLQVTDAAGRTSLADAQTISIQNVAPTAQIVAPTTASKGSPVTFQAIATDPGTTDVLTYSWRFGDLNTGSGSTVNHTYKYKGTYKVTLTVTDQDGAKTTVTTTITVS